VDDIRGGYRPQWVGTPQGVPGRREMLTWIRRHARSDRVTERRAVELVYQVFGPDVDDVTPSLEKSRAAAA
jgi:hypothetical protein